MKSQRTKTETLLEVMNILAWLVAITLSIKAFSFLTTYSMSLFKPEVAKDLYQGLNLYELRKYNIYQYSFKILCHIMIDLSLAYISFLATQIISKINLKKPFITEVVQLLERISYILLGLWMLMVITNIQYAYLLKTLGSRQGEWIHGGPYIFMTGLIFLIAQVYKRGVEIQADNDLTI